MSIFRSRIHRRRSRVMWTATSCLFETCSLRFCATWSFWTRCLERSNTNCLRTDLFFAASLVFSHHSVFIKILFFNAIYLIWIVTFPFLLKGVGHLAQTTIIVSPLFPLHSFEIGYSSIRWKDKSQLSFLDEDSVAVAKTILAAHDCSISGKIQWNNRIKAGTN